MKYFNNDAIIKELAPVFAGNLLQALIMDPNITDEVIDDYTKQFIGPLVDEVVSSNKLNVTDEQKREVENLLTAPMRVFIEKSFKELKNSADKLYDEYNLEKNIPLDEVAIAFKEQMQKDIGFEIIKNTSLNVHHKTIADKMQGFQKKALSLLANKEHKKAGDLSAKEYLEDIVGAAGEMTKSYTSKGTFQDRVSSSLTVQDKGGGRSL